jgi:hypothetical protein
MSQRTEFVNEFTKELILNSMSEQSKEKLRQAITRKVAQKLAPSILNLTKKEEIVFVASPKPEVKTELVVPLPAVEVGISEADFYNGLYLSKIARIISNLSVVSVECPGPGRFLNVRTISRQSITKISLTKEEIENILASFSEKAKIPRIGGVFKAIVNNLLITAIDSDVTGARFIISKMSSQPSMYLE